MILTPLQKMPKNGEDWSKLIIAKSLEKLPKVQNIAQSGHTATYSYLGVDNRSLIHQGSFLR